MLIGALLQLFERRCMEPRPQTEYRGLFLAAYIRAKVTFTDLWSKYL